MQLVKILVICVLVFIAYIWISNKYKSKHISDCNPILIHAIDATCEEPP